MKLRAIVYSMLLMGCMNDHAQSQNFTGSYVGQQPGITSAAILKATANILSGNFELNGRPGNITASINGTHCEGKIYDIQMQKDYAFTGRVSIDSLNLAIVFPELNNQVINLAMKRMEALNNADNSMQTSGSQNAALVGLWRYTETFSSGSGDNYTSFSTDYFMEFKADGTVLSWKGKSAGGMGDISLESNAGAVEKGGWYTEGKTLFLTDLATGNKASLLFYAEPNRMMLHNGGKEKKIMMRVR